MKNYFKTLVSRLWIYILVKIHAQVTKHMSLSEKPYVVYFNTIYPEVYICPNGDSAVQLVKLYEQLNTVTGRTCVKIIYGPVEVIFKVKIPRLMDMIFIWAATEIEQKQVFDLIIETPMKAR